MEMKQNHTDLKVDLTADNVDLKADLKAGLMEMKQNYRDLKAEMMEQVQLIALEIKGDITEELRHEVDNKLQQPEEQIHQDVDEIRGEVRQLDISVNEVKEQIKGAGMDMQTLKETMKDLKENKEPNIIVRGYHGCNLEVPMFAEYRKLPMEFIQRIKEYFIDSAENKWCKMRITLDQCFKVVSDNWWGSARDTIENFEDFMNKFKGKYWSTLIQGRIRDNISGRKNESGKGLTPSAYFLGKIRRAKYLDPSIPEPILVRELAHHFHECVYYAYIAGHINKVEGMEAVLSNAEPYRLSYQRPHWYDQVERNKPRYEQPQGSQTQPEKRQKENDNKGWQGNNKNYEENRRNNGPSQRFGNNSYS